MVYKRFNSDKAVNAVAYGLGFTGLSLVLFGLSEMVVGYGKKE
jgi:hypothetical protein